MNSENSNIQFTAEKVLNNSINFLDLKISRKINESLSFGIYRKPTHTDKYLNFNSYNPTQHKNSVIRTLIHRADTLCDAENKQEEMDHICNVLKNNQYPKKSIDQVIKKVRDDSDTSVSGSLPTSYVSIPYVAGTSERISRIFRKYDINVAHQPSRKIKNELCHLKDRRSVNERAGVVYQLDCGDCNASYIGETGQVKYRMILIEHIEET